MIQPLVQPFQTLMHLFFPNYCMGCFTDLPSRHQLICPICDFHLPLTGFADLNNNPVEKIFRGRLSATSATAAYYFTRNTLLQELIFSKLGYTLSYSHRFQSIDCIIPLPLHKEKEMVRGYNQAALIAEGIGQVLCKPVYNLAVTREKFTESQTRQSRDNRWLNMQNIFRVHQSNLLMNKHCLLVDDVITTGATLEACGKSLLQVPGCQISIATVAFTSLTG
jgi:ComF family protein